MISVAIQNGYTNIIILINKEVYALTRAITKSDLIDTANGEFTKLLALISAMSEEEQNAAFNFDNNFLEKHKEAHWVRDKNLRDVLIHLYEWHRLLLNWITANQNGELKPFIPSPYNWKTYGQMNVDFWLCHQKTLYQKSKDMLKQSHFDVITLINSFSDSELFTKKHFSWTGTSTLGSYCVSATSSHYNWAIKKIKIHRKFYQGTK